MSKEKEKEKKPSWKYSMKDVSFWTPYESEDKQVMGIGFREEKNKGYTQAILKITPLNSDNKKDTLESDGDYTKYDEGFFSLSNYDLIKLEKALQLMFLGKISQTEINHIDSDSGNGITLEVNADKDEQERMFVVVSILIIEDMSIIRQYSHELNKQQTIILDVDPETGEGQELSINVDFQSFYETIRTGITYTNGAFDSINSLKGGSSSRRTSNVKGGIAKKSRRKKTKGVSSKSNSKSSSKDAKVKKASTTSVKDMFND